MRPFRDDQPVGGDASLAQRLQLRHKVGGVHHHARAEDAQRAFVEDAGRNQVQREFAVFVDDGMAGVSSPLIAYDHVRFGGEVVDHLALALISELSTHHCVNHAGSSPVGLHTVVQLFQCMP